MRGRGYYSIFKPLLNSRFSSFVNDNGIKSEMLKGCHIPFEGDFRRAMHHLGPPKLHYINCVIQGKHELILNRKLLNQILENLT